MYPKFETLLTSQLFRFTSSGTSTKVLTMLVTLDKSGESDADILLKFSQPLKAASILVQIQTPQFLISNNFNLSPVPLNNILPVAALTFTS